MKNICRLLLFCCIILSYVNNTYASESADDNWKMWHGEQDALVLGKIESGENGKYQIDVIKCLYPRGIVTDDFRQLPSEEIPKSIVVNNLLDYKISYNGKTQPEIGDNIIVSLDKEAENWQCNYSPMEVSGTDYKTLEFTTSANETAESFAWLTFVKTDGKINEFKFENDNGKLKVIGKGKFDDGKIVEDVIYEKYTKDFEIPVKISFSPRVEAPPLWSVIIAGVVFIAVIVFLAHKIRNR